MPKTKKAELQLETWINRYYRLRKRLIGLETELNKIQKDCPEKTSCYLRYSPHLCEAYGAGPPHKGTVKIVNGKLKYSGELEEWQIVLANFYAEEANRLLQQRDVILVKMNRITSRCVLIGKYDSNLRHLRKPWF